MASIQLWLSAMPGPARPVKLVYLYIYIHIYRTPWARLSAVRCMFYWSLCYNCLPWWLCSLPWRWRWSCTWFSFDKAVQGTVVLCSNRAMSWMPNAACNEWWMLLVLLMTVRNIFDVTWGVQCVRHHWVSFTETRRSWCLFCEWVGMWQEQGTRFLFVVAFRCTVCL